MKKSLFLLLLICFAFIGVARAQQALDYYYGFEDGNLSNDGWIANITSTYSGIKSGGPEHTGSYGFAFNYSEQNGSLISPLLTGGDRGVNVSFWYKEYNSSYGDEQFYVGYTTDETVTNVNSFTYGDIVTASTTWQEYTNLFPAGTKRIAIKYVYNDAYYLFLDDFSFEAFSTCDKPTDLTISYREGDTEATVTWQGRADTYNVDVNGTIESVNGLSYTIRDLVPATTYYVKVQANCGDELSGWVTADFSTPCPETYAIPYAYGFEDGAGLNCWTATTNGNIINEGFPRTGEGCFMFNYTTTPPQYLISPELSGIVRGLHVEFYYRQYTNGTETFKVGYSTTDNDPESFTWGDEITASTSYQRFSANYPAETKYVAIQHTADDQYYFFVDDFLFEESASCLEPSGLQVANITTTGASISWTAGGEESAWDLYVTDDATVVPDENTTPSYANTSENPYSLGNLTPGTIYYVYVRAICGDNEMSAWSSPVVFNTECEGMSLPYTYGFEDSVLPVCWNVINTNTGYCGVDIMAPSSSSTNRVLAFYLGSTATLVAVLPEVDAAYPLNGYQISFDACYANTSSSSMTAGKLGIGIMTDPTDFTTFELVQEVDVTSGFSTYESFTVMFNNYTGTGHYIAIQDIRTQNGYVFVDNISVTELPSCIPPTNLAVTGGKNAVVTWEGEGSFDIAITTEETDDPTDFIQVSNFEGNEYNLANYTSVGINYVYVRANCSDNNSGYSGWVSTSFDVNYCTPNPTSHDGSGITGVTFGTGDYVVTNGDGSASLPSAAPYYGDYSSMIGAVQAGVESTIAITTSTGNYPYTFVIWVDLDNSMSFEDSEILYIGKASTGAGTLNATITIPATQTVGDYRMRIYGADSYFNSFYSNGNTNWDAAHDPCSSGSYRHAHDYTLRVLEAPSCLAAGDVTVDNITSTSAVISWTNNNGADATYTVMQGETVLTTNAVDSFTLEDLTAATTYPAGTFTIISDCDETAIANVPAFSTPCDDITTLPWSEDFESFDNNTVPMCWDNSASTSSTINTSPYYIWGVVTVSGNNMMKMENYWAQTGTALINTPTFVLPAEGTCQLSFDYAHNASCGAFAVNVSTDNGTTFTELASYTKGSGSSHTEPGEFTPATISLADYAGESIILQFFANANYGNGAIFVDNIEVKAVSSLNKTINGYGEGTGNYYLIASPVGTVTPSTDNGFVTNAFDLYWFNEATDGEGNEWINYNPNTFDLETGKGYLYASRETTELTFTGTLVEGTEYEVTLAKTDGTNWSGWNLVGNPFGVAAYIADGRKFYTMNSDGDKLIVATSKSIEAMEGIFVNAEEDEESMIFTTTEPESNDKSLAINLSNGRNVIDRAIVSFNEGRMLPKFQFRENSTKVYIEKDNKDYAVVNADEMGEMPVNFKAESNGNYTISFNTENVEFGYLHLIDNMTGDDVDLLSTPSYSFDAKVTDYASRFKLVFAAGNANDDNFAFYNNGNIVINNEGNAILNIVDVLGRTISSQNINGSENVTINAKAGVYMIQLIQGNNVKTQKIVVE